MHSARQIQFAFKPASATARGIKTHFKTYVRSFASRSWERFSSLMSKFTWVLKKAMSWPAQELIVPLGTLIGAAACGWWSQSLAAALFAGIGLFFLAGLWKTSAQVSAALTQSEARPRFRNQDNRTPEDSDDLKQAIRRLEPWLANEVSLTEENAKESCAVLLDSLALR